ncbi:proton-conducting transporter transmembrane domain-containing protein [Halopseudomonas sp.]|uniref:proton-conducting transporter transmembrane domain-containing protein n=1 Tax=Halopseudomonas sp. TaxID=2901191 RepID=UPI003002013F
MSPLTWLLVALAPLLALALLWRWPDRAAPWLWLSCLPALLASFWPPAALEPAILWPGATWGAEDMLARAWLAFTALLWGCASVYAGADLVGDRRRLRFWCCWLLSLCGNLLLIIAQDAGSFYVGFSLMSLAAYGLIVHQRGPAPRQAGRLYLQLAILGEMLIFAGMMLRIHEADGAFALATWQGVPTGWLTASVLLIGFGLKAGFWPLHVWLPLAHPAAPAAASAVLSGAMIKAGILGLWRFLPEQDPVLQSWALPLLAIGAISAFYGVALGLLQSRAKAALAYSSVSQIGYLLVVLALAWLHPESRSAAGILLALYGVHHGLAKGALFMGAGLAAHYRLRPWHWLAMALPAMALAGLPLTSGAAVKILLKDTVYASDVSQWSMLLTAGAAATAILLMRALWLMWQQQPGADAGRPPSTQLWPWLALCMMPAALPWLWPELRTALLASLPPGTLWAGLWPLLLAGAIAWAVQASGWQIPARLRRLPQPARAGSLRLKRLLQRPPVPAVAAQVDEHRWRTAERYWNRLWRGNAVTLSAWLLILLLLLGWLG